MMLPNGNWGYEGSGDNAEYIMDDEWITGGESYSYDKKMLYDFRTL